MGEGYDPGYGDNGPGPIDFGECFWDTVLCCFDPDGYCCCVCASKGRSSRVTHLDGLPASSDNDKGPGDKKWATQPTTIRPLHEITRKKREPDVYDKGVQKFLRENQGDAHPASEEHQDDIQRQEDHDPSVPHQDAQPVSPQHQENAQPIIAQLEDRDHYSSELLRDNAQPNNEQQKVAALQSVGNDKF